jgi:hypothetical protein
VDLDPLKEFENTEDNYYVCEGKMGTPRKHGGNPILKEMSC